jgi:predicted enzyme related to lactoylglutathione lyase
VSVSDLQRGLAVYSQALGLPVVWANDDVARLDADGVEVMLHRRTPVPGQFDVAATFDVDDVDGVTARLLAAGAVAVRGPVDEPWGERQSVLTDPDGQVFCVVTPAQ